MCIHLYLPVEKFVIICFRVIADPSAIDLSIKSKTDVAGLGLTVQK